MQQPTIGRIVHYRLSDADVAAIHAASDATRGRRNPVSAGQVYPAQITAVFDPAGGTANMVVQLDGLQQHWVTSSRRGEPADGLETTGETIPPGTWCWPPRV